MTGKDQGEFWGWTGGNLRAATEKWLVAVSQREDTKKKLLRSRENELGNLTNIKLGPPIFMDALTACNWRRDLERALSHCVSTYLLDAYEKKCEDRWLSLKREIISRLVNNGDWGQMYQEIQKSFVKIGKMGWIRKDEDLNTWWEECLINLKVKGNMTSNKTPRHSPPLQTTLVGTYSNNNPLRLLPCMPLSPPPLSHSSSSFSTSFKPFQPLPPLPPGHIQGMNTIPESTHQEVDSNVYVGELRRGEPYCPITDTFGINQLIKASRDPALLISWAIHGMEDRQHLIYNSLARYLIWYRELEEGLFKPRKVALKTGKMGRIISWEEGLGMIQREEYLLGEWDFQLISQLYQCSIRVFSKREGVEKEDRGVFECRWQTRGRYGRVVNLLLLGNRWSLLEQMLTGEVEVEHKKETERVILYASRLGNSHIVDSGLPEEKRDERKERVWTPATVENKGNIADKGNYDQQTLDSRVARESCSTIDHLTLQERDPVNYSDTLHGRPDELVGCERGGNDDNSYSGREKVRKSICRIEKIQGYEGDIKLGEIKEIAQEVKGTTVERNGEKAYSEGGKVSTEGVRDHSLSQHKQKKIIEKDSWSLVSSSLDNRSEWDLAYLISDDDSIDLLDLKKGSKLDNTGVESSEKSREIGQKEIYESSKEGEPLGEQVGKISRLDSLSSLSSLTVKSLERDLEYLLSDNDNIDLLDLYEDRYESSGKVAKAELGKRVEEISNASDNSVLAMLFPETLKEDNPGGGASNIRRDKGVRRSFKQKWRNLVKGIKRREAKKREIVETRRREKEEATRLVFDLTSKELSSEEIELLGKGESFCITNHKIDEDTFKVDLYNFQRRLRLHEEFRELEEVENRGTEGGRLSINQRGSRQSRCSIRRSYMHEGRVQEPETLTIRETRVSRTSRVENDQGDTHRGSLRNSVRRSIIQGRSSVRNTQAQTPKHVAAKERKLPSSYDPLSHNRNLARYNTCIQEESLLALRKEEPFKDNITSNLRKAFKTLSKKIQDKEIIITRADKGSGLVAVDYEVYIEKGTRYIQHEAQAYSVVQETEDLIVNNIVKRRDGVVKELKKLGIISGATATFCIKQLEEKITGMKFYYKIHKDSNITTMPLRPLQSCIAAPTHHLSLVLTDLLQPLLNSIHIPSFIYDSNQLLLRLHNLGCIPEGHTLISSDVSALYPSIPHEKGMQCMSDFLREKTEYSRQQITAIIQALKLVVTENYVQWDNCIYKQTSGVAMGTPVAVAYANIFMHWIDKQIRIKAPFVHEHIRYIDDNLFILPKDRIGDLMEIANNILIPHIKFTYEELREESDSGLPFLDTQLFISEGLNIESRLYTKKTDRHAYLLPTSFHPPHITRNIPASVFSRIRRICSREEWFTEDAAKVVTWLANRGYDKRQIQRSLVDTQKKIRWDMIMDIERKRNKGREQEHSEVYKIPIIITYNQHVNSIKKVLANRQNLLDSSFNKTKVVPRLVFRRHKNINDAIVQKGLRGPIKQILEEDKKFSRCEDKPKYRIACPCRGRHRQDICRCCAHSEIVLTGIEVKIHKPVNCKSKNVVYMIGCRQCSMRYVGETQQALRDRLVQHLNNIDKGNQPLYAHFKQIHAPASLYVGVLETVRSVQPVYRKVREAWWINRLQTLEPSGLNVKLECNQIYTDMEGGR